METICKWEIAEWITWIFLSGSVVLWIISGGAHQINLWITVSLVQKCTQSLMLILIGLWIIISFVSTFGILFLRCVSLSQAPVKLWILFFQRLISFSFVAVGCQQHCNSTCSPLFKNIVNFGSIMVRQLGGWGARLNSGQVLVTEVT